MILVDSSIWIDHFRKHDADLVSLLKENLVLIHPLIIEELACGELSPYAQTLELLEALPQAPRINHFEFLAFVSGYKLQRIGLGAVDVHLLASARLAKARLWSRDRALAQAAARLGITASEKRR